MTSEVIATLPRARIVRGECHVPENVVKNLYLVLTIIGAIVPYVFFVEHFAAAGSSPIVLLKSAFANGAAAGFAADVLLSSIVFCIHLDARKVPHRWVYVLVAVTIGLSCALPLYLYVTARTAEARPAAAIA